MAVKASERVKRYQNPNGPTISTVERKVIEQDGLYSRTSTAPAPSAQSTTGA